MTAPANIPAKANFLVAAACLLEWAGLFPAYAGELMAIQFIVIHSSAFVLWIPFAVQSELWRTRCLSWLLLLYIMFAFAAGGVSGVMEFCGLTLVTYHRYVFKADTSSRVPVFSRWAFCFAAFIFALALGGGPGDVQAWDGNRRIAFSGAIYFFLAGLMERSEFHETGWKRALRWLAEKDPGFKARMPGWMALAAYENPPREDKKP